LLTRDHTIDLPPTTAAVISLVNNTVTSSGLEQQLLSTIIQHELPEIETKKRDLLKEERKFKLQLDSLEKQLLALLAKSKGDILENVALVTSLEETKTKSISISERIKESTKMSTTLEAQRNVYRNLAIKGTELY